MSDSDEAARRIDEANALGYREGYRAALSGEAQPTYAEHMAHAARCPQCQLNAAAADAPPDPEAIGVFVRTLTGGPFRTDADEVRRFWPTSAALEDRIASKEQS